MTHPVRRLISWLVMIGIDPRKFISFLRGLPFYLRDRKALLRQQELSDIDFPLGRSHPVLDERFSSSGTSSGHYFHQDLLVASRIFANQPERHVDIGSRIDGFVAHVASFRAIEVIDFRPLRSKPNNISFIQADMMGELDAALTDYCDSVSCLHALEHFGLGRYGDSVKFDGYLDGLANIGKLLKSGGKLHLSVPIGPQRIEFNAHRVFSLSYLADLLEPDYRIDSFSYVDDPGDLHENVSLSSAADTDRNFGCTYGCGIFELTRR